MDASDARQVSGKLPETGDVLWCYFEYETKTGERIKHAQRHPVLVLANAVDGDGNSFLIVAGGSSVFGPDGRKRAINPHDFVIMKKAPCLGYKKHGVTDQLVADTKFSLQAKDVLALPYTDRWFYTPPGSHSPRIGKVLFDHEETMSAFNRAAMAAKIPDTLASIQNRLIKNVSKPADPDESETGIAS